MSEEKSVTLSEPGFSQIKDGKKKIEIRLNVGFFAHLKAGDKIIIIGSPDDRGGIGARLIRVQE